MAKTLSYINTTPKKGSTSQQQTSTAVSRPSYVGGGSSSKPTDVQLKKNYMAGILTGKGYALIDPDFIAADFYTWEFDGLYLRRRLLLLNGFTGQEPSALDDLNTPVESVLHGRILGNGSRGAFLGPLYAAGIYRDIASGLDIYAELKSAYAVLLASMKRMEKDHRNFLHNPAFTDGMEGWTAASDVSFLELNGIPLFLGGLFTFDSGVAAVREYLGRNMLYLCGSGVSQPSSVIRQQKEYDLYDEGEEPVQQSAETEDEGTAEGEEGEIEEVVIDIEDIEPVESHTSVKGKMYLEVRFICLSDGTMSVGMEGNGYQPADADDAALPFESLSVSAGTDWQIYRSEGRWDGSGTFKLSFTGEMYVDYVLLSDNPFEEAEDQRLSAYRQSLNNIKKAFVTINAVKAKLVEVNEYAKAILPDIMKRIDEVEEMVNEHSSDILFLYQQILSVNDQITAINGTLTTQAEEIAEANVNASGAMRMAALASIDADEAIALANSCQTSISSLEARVSALEKG